MGFRDFWFAVSDFRAFGGFELNSPQRVACSDDVPKSPYLRSGSIIVEP